MADSGGVANQPIRYDPRSEALVWGDVDRRLRDHGFTFRLDEIADCGATALRKALVAVAEDGFESIVEVSTVDRDRFDEDTSPIERTRFDLEGDQLILRVWFETEEYAEEEDELRLVQPLLADLLKRGNATLLRVEHEPYLGGSGEGWVAVLQPATRARSVRELYALGEQVAALLGAAAGGQLTRATTLDLLRAGQAAALIGQPEGAWLDVKSQLYDLKQLSGKISLAQAVATFANGEQGGIVVLGMATRRHPGGEVIKSVNPVPTDARTVHQHRQALQSSLYPLPDQLGVELVDVAGGKVVVIHVPPQAEENKPFLVHGAIVEGKVEGAFISIIRRSGEHSFPVTAPAIHAWISAGRGLMRSGYTSQPKRRTRR